ncbi:anthranilate synthase component I [Kurthia sibirica]|uniref:Anthranilate synthase component 1 n=1 Tax=Kurthia sibirica TaxID=202750 RepID=A0A2U3AN24_9BACL|nr:anthranilate synthase component I [Kurthia sibirica]PWI25925.1 anthranilate synthase component I [Kurthia sibirica]GEK34281.1 anthranilate synthase component I [Kurthia sibirica]
MTVTTTRAYYQTEMEGDMHTPISIYHALSGQKKILFESSAKHEESGRYSFIATNPSMEFIAVNKEITIIDKGQKSVETSVNPFHRLKELLPIDNSELPFSFYGGAVGYIGYETAFYHEQIGDFLEDPIDMPDMHMLFFETFIMIDHLKQKLYIASIDLFNVGLSQADLRARTMVLEKQLIQPIQPLVSTEHAPQFTAMMSQADFCQLVVDAKAHIEAGDLFQIVLSQRFKAHYEGDAMHLYRQLRKANPSPYMYYLDFADYTVLGTSPESLVKVENRIVTTNPIAGTRPRGATVEEDLRYEKELLADDKELAEHRMLVDLGRNDIGKLSKTSTVTVQKYMAIERYKYVMHIVSEVTGELLDTIHPLDVIASCLPAGTVSGAPKIRAMQLINRFEKQKRGVYAGAVGYISPTGNMDLALAIRTMVLKDQYAYVQAGAGIVYHSQPLKEFEETVNKAKALLEVMA